MLDLNFLSQYIIQIPFVIPPPPPKRGRGVRRHSYGTAWRRRCRLGLGSSHRLATAPGPPPAAAATPSTPAQWIEPTTCAPPHLAGARADAGEQAAQRELVGQVLVQLAAAHALLDLALHVVGALWMERDRCHAPGVSRTAAVPSLDGGCGQLHGARAEGTPQSRCYGHRSPPSSPRPRRAPRRPSCRARRRSAAGTTA